LYALLLLLHSYNRWLVIIAVAWALILAWTGCLGKRSWNKWDDRAGWLFAAAFSLQFVLGVLLYFQPDGMAQAALRDLSAAIQVRDLRFFGLEHPPIMILALALAHLGRARSRKAVVAVSKYRWAAICFSIATALVLLAIPWWRPLFRTPMSDTPPTATTTAARQMSTTSQATEPASLQGDAAQGEVLFKQGIGGQASCATCHALNDQRIVGPGMSGIALRAGQRVSGKISEQYLRESILYPNSFVVPEYPSSVMPSNFGQVLTPQQVDNLVAYLLTLK
jgi:mono/diheme cytochrome c family protein